MVLALALGGCATNAPHTAGGRLAPNAQKPRVVVTTDPELDDSNSLIRYLLYSTDFRTEGLVYASSQFHWKGDGTGKKWAVPNREYFRFGVNLCPCESWRWAPTERFIDDAVDIYERVYANLRVHQPDYPTPGALRSKIRWGNVEFDGDISKDTPGSNLIRDLLLDDDPEPIYLLAWGGASTIARALKSIQEQHEGTAAWPAVRAKVSSKAILSLSGDQDDTYANYIRPNWPDIRSLTAGQGGVGVGYGAFVFASAENAPYFSSDWQRANVSSQGPFGAHYRVWGDGKQMVPGDRFDYFGLAGQTIAELRAKGYVVWLPPRPKGEFLGEGDTFTFFNLIDNGLGAHREETPGGWAGRVAVNPASPRARQGGAATSFEEFMRNLERIRPEGPSSRPPSPHPNFTPAAQNGFAARMKWSVTPTYAAANHEPTVAIRGNFRVSARAGETVRLEGTVSDPDGHAVAMHWWRWKDVDTYPGEVSLSHPTALATRLRVPNDATPGQTIQLVLEATDNGTPALTRYQRVIITVVRLDRPTLRLLGRGDPEAGRVTIGVFRRRDAHKLAVEEP
ncbi:MAG: nucleoside hydrolase-like domain-containing protein [Gemmatimonadaceae bacterium]